MLQPHVTQLEVTMISSFGTLAGRFTGGVLFPSFNKVDAGSLIAVPDFGVASQKSIGLRNTRVGKEAPCRSGYRLSCALICDGGFEEKQERVLIKQHSTDTDQTSDLLFSSRRPDSPAAHSVASPSLLIHRLHTIARHRCCLYRPIVPRPPPNPARQHPFRPRKRAL